MGIVIVRSRRIFQNWIRWPGTALPRWGVGGSAMIQSNYPSVSGMFGRFGVSGLSLTNLRGVSCWLLSLGFAVAAAHAERVGSVNPRLAVEPVQPPSSWQTRRDYSRFPVSRAIALPPVPEAEAAARLEPGRPDAPFQVGFSRVLPEAQRGDLARTAKWTALPGGGQVASFSVHSPEADSVRLAVQAELPDGARLRFFQPHHADRRYPVFKRSDFIRKEESHGGVAAASRQSTRWSPSIPGDVAGVEIEIPPFADPAEVSFRIVGASHIHRSRSETSPPGALVQKSGTTCDSVQAVCKSLPSCPSSGVARLVFTTGDGNTFVCTGTAVNSTRPRDDNFDAPFVLTAHHCIHSQSVADTVETTWHYEYSDCGGTTLRNDSETLSGGADLLANDADSDGSLLRLRLRGGLPGGVCLAAWDATGGWQDGTDVFSAHHPEGKVREWSGGAIERTGRSLLDEDVVDTIDVVWTEGNTRAGSSGGGLFTPGGDGDDVLIGMLTGGPEDDCTRDSYGRLDRFFANHAGVHLVPTDPPPADDHGGSADEATGVLTGSETAGQIDDGADADVFRVDVVEPGILTVYTTGSLDTFGRLKREDGSIVDYDDDGGSQTNFRIEAEVEAGTYYVKVTGFNHAAVGAYRLHVDFVPADGSNTVLVPLFLSASALESVGRQGFVRVFNRSGKSGEVRIAAIDDRGEQAGPVTLSIGSFETRPFNSQDLEQGNVGKGLSGGIGPGTGDWRLQFESDLDIEVGAYIRTRDGFLTAMHDLVIVEDRTGAHHVPVFNPASNTNQRSRLRLINPDPDDSVDVTINGYDDNGDEGATTVELRLLPGSVRTLSAPQLEDGDPNLTGQLGDGEGKWRLFIEADGRIHVVNLLDSETGNLTNLSLPGGDNYSQ